MSRNSIIIICIAGILAIGVVVNCNGEMGGPGTTHEWAGTPEEVPVACDPDGMAPCPDDFFVCVEDDVGNKRCEGQNPALPDSGQWDCYEEGTTMVCRGDHLPADDGGMWDCVESAESVVCRGHAYVPSTGGDEQWTCWYEGDLRVCESGDGTTGLDGSDGETGDGGEDHGDDDDDNPWDQWFPDEDGNGIPDEFEDFGVDDLNDLFDLFDNGDDGTGNDDDGTGEDCVCVPGAWRYCDTPTYCRWGVQYCDADGMDWGRCDEISAIPAACAPIDGWYSPAAEACCVEQGLCCQDMWDLDHDGDTWESLGNCTDIVCN